MSSPFDSWNINKQYLAAQFYLAEERPIFINEAQRAQLGALHLQTSHGPHDERKILPELLQCPPPERKRREEEWKKLSKMPKIVAMRKFLDLMNSLFPNWTKNRKLYDEFELDWLRMQAEIMSLSPSARKSIKDEGDSVCKVSKYNRSMSPRGQSVMKSIDQMPKGISVMRHITESAYLGLPRNIRINATSDASDIMHGLKKSEKTRYHDVKKESDYYRLPKLGMAAHKYKKNKAEDLCVLKHFVENLQSWKGGNIRQTSANKMPADANRDSIRSETQLDQPTYKEFPDNYYSYRTESLEELVNNLLDTLHEEKTRQEKKYGNLDKVIQDAFEKSDTQFMKSMLRSKFNMISYILDEIAKTLHRELCPRSKLIAEVNNLLYENLEVLMEYLDSLDNKKEFINEDHAKIKKSQEALSASMNSLKEIYDLKNAELNLPAITNDKRAEHQIILKEKRAYLTKDQSNLFINMESLLIKYEEKVNDLQSELENRIREINLYEIKLKEIQDSSYKDNIDISNQYKTMKESLGLIRGKSAFDTFSDKRQIEELMQEKEKLQADKKNLMDTLRDNQMTVDLFTY